MAYISKRDGRKNTNPESEKDSRYAQPKTANTDYDEYDDDLDGEDDVDEDEDFREKLNTAFPLPGGETDGDA